MSEIQSEAALGSNADWSQQEKEDVVQTMRSLFPLSPEQRLALIRRVIAKHRDVLERLKDR